MKKGMCGRGSFCKACQQAEKVLHNIFSLGTLAAPETDFFACIFRLVQSMAVITWSYLPSDVHPDFSQGHWK